VRRVSASDLRWTLVPIINSRHRPDDQRQGPDLTVFTFSVPTRVAGHRRRREFRVFFFRLLISTQKKCPNVLNYILTDGQYPRCYGRGGKLAPSRYSLHVPGLQPSANGFTPAARPFPPLITVPSRLVQVRGVRAQVRRTVV
jgi:hypothetical protein